MVLEDSILNAPPAHRTVFNLQSAPHTNVPIKNDRRGLRRNAVEDRAISGFSGQKSVPE